MIVETLRTTGFGPRRVGTGSTLKLTMQELWLTGRVLPVGAALEVRHLFKCGGTRPVEAVYAFMLPRDATLRRFRVIGENFSVRSELMPTAKAVRKYERGIEEGHLSALARHYRDGMVNLALGNLRPGDTVIVVVEIVAGVETRDGGIRFRFPFTLAPTYHRRARFVESEPGIGEMELPEDEFGDVILPQWVKDARDLHRVGFHLDVVLGQPIAEISSPSHSIRVTQQSEGIWRVALAPEADIPNRDLVLEARTQQLLEAVFGGVAPDGKGHFIAVVPSSRFGESVAMPRRTVFVIDRSGSMDGEPLKQAVSAVNACLDTLSPQDRFGLVVFDDQVEVFQPKGCGQAKLCEANQANRDAAEKFLAELQTGGGTELAAGIQAACDMLSESGGDIFLLTDGQVSGTEEILERARRCGVRLHCLGIGSASQDRFIALLVRQTGGESRFVTAREHVCAAAVELFKAVSRPVAVDISVKPSSSAHVRLEPKPANVVFEGTPLVIYGETDGAKPRTLHISWNRAGTRCHLEVPLVLRPCADAETAKLLRGARLITDAEALLKAESAGEFKTLERLSRKYGLASRAMALVAVIKRPGDRPGEVPETRVVPVGMPEDTTFGVYFSQGPVLYCRPWGGQVFALLDSVPRVPVPPRRRPRTSKPETATCPGNQHTVQETEGQRSSEEPSGIVDLALKLEKDIQPDGGLSGNSVESRVLKSLIVVLFLVSAGAKSSALSKHFPQYTRALDRLLDFLEASRILLTGPQRAIVTRLIRLARRNVCVEGNWIAEAAALASGAEPDAARLWNMLQTIRPVV